MSNPTLPFITVGIAVGSNEAKKLVSGKGLDIQPVIGGFVLGIFLFAMYELNEKIATRFCILIIVTALLINGVDVFNFATRIFGGTVPKNTGKRPPTPNPKTLDK